MIIYFWVLSSHYFVSFILLPEIKYTRYLIIFKTNWVISLSTANLLLYRNCWSLLFRFTPLFFVGFVFWLLEYYSCVSWLHEWLLLCGLHLIWYFLYRLLFYFSSMFYFLLIIFFYCGFVYDKRSSFRVLLLVFYYTFIF